LLRIWSARAVRLCRLLAVRSWPMGYPLRWIDAVFTRLALVS
jgi:hypothetical protein